MAKISDIVKEVSVSSKIDKTTVSNVARILREKGLLSQKGRGKAAAKATTLDAARLYIAIMIGGKTKDAAQEVKDFGQLVLHNKCETRSAWVGINLQSMCALEDGHTLEEAIAALIYWHGDAEYISKMVKASDEAMPEMPKELRTMPSLKIDIKLLTMTAEIYFGDHHYIYHHPLFLQYYSQSKLAGDIDIGAFENEWLAANEKVNDYSDKWQSLSDKYGGLSRVSGIYGNHIISIGQVVADQRNPGERDE